LKKLLEVHSKYCWTWFREMSFADKCMHGGLSHFQRFPASSLHSARRAIPKWDTSVCLHPPSDLQARSVQLNFLRFCKMISPDTQPRAFHAWRGSTTLHRDNSGISSRRQHNAEHALFPRNMPAKWSVPKLVNIVVTIGTVSHPNSWMV
jgi:hypothetical protein